MIDVEWLKTVQFEADSGRVTGLAGIGSQWIVFKCQASGARFEDRGYRASGWLIRTGGRVCH
jgi:hypothetical protein